MSVNSKMAALADEIRTLNGSTSKLGIDAMTTEVNRANTEVESQADLINQIVNALDGKAGGVALPELSNPAGPHTILEGYQSIGEDGSVINGTMPIIDQASPTISVSSSGLITASITESSGYIEGNTTSSTQQLTTQAAKTITPSTSNQTAVAKGRYTTGAVTVTGDSNLIASNIKSGVSIFGVNGTYEGSGSSGGSIETCTLSVTSTNEFYFIYNEIENGIIVAKCNDTDSISNITVPCSSILAVYDYQMMEGVPSPTTMENITIVYDGTEFYGAMSAFQISSVPNSVCILSF